MTSFDRRAIPAFLLAIGLLLYIFLLFSNIAGEAIPGWIVQYVIVGSVAFAFLLPLLPYLTSPSYLEAVTLHACNVVYRSVRHVSLVLLVGSLLAVPIGLFFLKERAEITQPAVLYRREFPTLVSLDTAISQHFFIIFGYAISAIFLALLGSFASKSTSIIDFLHSLMTLSGITGEFPAAWSLLMASYGFVGVALLVSLIISAHDDVNQSFSRSNQEIEEFLADAFLHGSSADDVEWSNFRLEERNFYMKTMAGDMLKQAIDRGDFGTPTLKLVWHWLRLQNYSEPWHDD